MPGWPVADRGFVPKHPLDSAHRSGAGLEWSFRVRRERTAGSRGPVIGEDGSLRRTIRVARLEAVLLISDGAVSSRRLAQLATLADTTEVRRLIDHLNTAYDRSHSAFRIERVATGYQLLTSRDLAPWLDKLHDRQERQRLSAPTMETLTIVAWRQPVTRADVEAIRGVQSAEILKQLMERGMIRVAGHEDSLGRPFLYETTRRFLESFGMQSLDDLRNVADPPGVTVPTAVAGAAGDSTHDDSPEDPDADPEAGDDAETDFPEADG